MSFNKNNKFFMLVVILFNFISSSTQAGDFERDLQRVNQHFEVELNKDNLGTILQYCFPQYEKNIKVSNDLQGKFTVLSYLATTASQDTLRHLIWAFEKNISVKMKDKNTSGRIDRFYFYDTIVQGLATRKDWILFSSLLHKNTGSNIPNQLESYMTSMLARRMIYNLIKHENLFILNCFHNNSGKASVHECSRKLGIFDFQPASSDMFNSVDMLKLVAKDIIEALSASKANSPSESEAEDIIRTFIDFYDNTLPNFGRSTERCQHLTFKTYDILSLAKASFPTETKRIGATIDQIFKEAKSNRKIHNTQFNAVLDNLNNKKSNCQPQKRSLSAPENGAGILMHEGDGERKKKRLKVSYQESEAGIIADQSLTITTDLLSSHSEPDRREALFEIQTPMEEEKSFLPFGWLDCEKKTCSYSLQVIVGNYPNDVILKLLTHSRTPELCKINEQEIPTALIMTAYKKLDLLKGFLDSDSFVTHGLDRACGDNLTVREAIFMYLIDQDEEGQCAALDLLIDRKFIGQDQNNIKKLKEYFFKAYCANKISASVLLKYFSIPMETCPYLALNADNNDDRLRQEIIQRLLNTHENVAIFSLLAQESFVSINNAPTLALSIFEQALKNNNVELATQMLQLGIVSLDQSVPFAK